MYSGLPESSGISTKGLTSKEFPQSRQTCLVSPSIAHCLEYLCWRACGWLESEHDPFVTGLLGGTAGFHVMDYCALDMSRLCICHIAPSILGI